MLAIPEGNATREIGVFGVAVLASVFSANGSYTSAQSYVDGSIPAVAVGAVIVAIGAVVALAIPGRVAGGVRAAVPAGSSTSGLAGAEADLAA